MSGLDPLTRTGQPGALYAPPRQQLRTPVHSPSSFAAFPSRSAAPQPSAHDGDTHPGACEFLTQNPRGGVPGSYPSIQSRDSTTAAASADLTPRLSAQPRKYPNTSTSTAAAAANATTGDATPSFHTAKWEPSYAPPSLSASRLLKV